MAITMIAAGCTGNDADTTTYTDDEYEVTTTIPEGAEGQWCPVGSTWEAVNPETGETVSMEVVGTEIVEGVVMCKAIVEIEPVTEDIAKMEYLWSEDEESFIWTNYYESGNVHSKVTFLDGKMTIIGEDGQVMSFDTNE
ncbi:MAG: hypothetical protein GKC08_00890 [Methanosarcinales archaeon]|nr:hypothetical protein [Methanosarcinales archaeon]